MRASENFLGHVKPRRVMCWPTTHDPGLLLRFGDFYNRIFVSLLRNESSDSVHPFFYYFSETRSSLPLLDSTKFY